MGYGVEIARGSLDHGVFVFFSSRRRHTRFDCDWSSDVCSSDLSEAIREYPELVQQYLGSVVPYNDNFFAALNSAVFTDGSFVYVPRGVRCPMELSTYFRINAESTGQFERTLIVADEGSYLSYLE